MGLGSFLQMTWTAKAITGWWTLVDRTRYTVVYRMGVPSTSVIITAGTEGNDAVSDIMQRMLKHRGVLCEVLLGDDSCKFGFDLNTDDETGELYMINAAKQGALAIDLQALFLASGAALAGGGCDLAMMCVADTVAQIRCLSDALIRAGIVSELRDVVAGTSSVVGHHGLVARQVITRAGVMGLGLQGSRRQIQAALAVVPNGEQVLWRRL